MGSSLFVGALPLTVWLRWLKLRSGGGFEGGSFWCGPLPTKRMNPSPDSLGVGDGAVRTARSSCDGFVLIRWCPPANCLAALAKAAKWGRVRGGVVLVRAPPNETDEPIARLPRRGGRRCEDGAVVVRWVRPYSLVPS